MMKRAEGRKGFNNREEKRRRRACARRPAFEGERSDSLRAARAFLEVYRTCHPDDRAETLEPTSDALPAFDRTAVLAKNRVLHGDRPTEEQMGSWRRIERRTPNRAFQGCRQVASLPRCETPGSPTVSSGVFDVLVQPGSPFAAEASLAQPVEEAPRLAEIF